MTLLYVALAGAIGAPLRYVVDAWLDDRLDAAFPWGTFAVNVAGSMVFGLLIGLQHHGHLSTHATVVFGTGLCGAFTTFSTHTFESIRLAEDGLWRVSAYNVIGTLLTCTMAAAAGFGIAALT